MALALASLLGFGCGRSHETGSAGDFEPVPPGETRPDVIRRPPPSSDTPPRPDLPPREAAPPIFDGIGPECDAHLQGVLIGTNVRDNVLTALINERGLPDALVEEPRIPGHPDHVVRLGRFVGRDDVFLVGDYCDFDAPPAPTESVSCWLLLGEMLDRAEPEASQALSGNPYYGAGPPPLYATGADASLVLELDRLVDVLRQAGICDRTITPEIAAYEAGLAIGTRELRTRIEGTAFDCDADALLIGPRSEAIANVERLARDAACPRAGADDPAAASRRAAVELELRNGIVEGIQRASGDLAYAGQYTCWCGGD